MIGPDMATFASHWYPETLQPTQVASGNGPNQADIVFYRGCPEFRGTSVAAR
jgi:hypothetical protein